MKGLNMGLFSWKFSYKNDRNINRLLITIFGIKIRLRKPVIFTGKHQNFGVNINSEELVILGNGPSLKDSFADKETYDFIKTKTKMVVNFFTEHPAFFELKPSYICYMDPLFWAENITKEDTINRLNKIKSVLSSIDWDIVIFMPKFAQEWNWFIDIPNKNSHVKIAYVNTAMNYRGKRKLFQAYQENISMPVPQNVLIGAIYIALQLRYKKIYFFGADHSWHLDLKVDDKNMVLIKVSHFYDNGEIKYNPFYKDATRTTTFTMRELFEIYALVHKQYEILEKYSKYLNARVYNMSSTSFIDAFERMSIKKEG